MQQLVDHKQAARETWATGDYDAMMRQERLYEVGASLVSRLGLGSQDSVLDVACGTGNATIPAARTGAQVTGVDLTPRMLEVADDRARTAGAQADRMIKQLTAQSTSAPTEPRDLSWAGDWPPR
jgi:ubiquinone/menaquinone biosynthesis C-methylase UbiE